ncbi:hypothetical protein BDA99DRAFT_225954 [Phascolomyces articulosus]|uniref:PH domain-containing protein n=1 Tax=Phascolomyces articulosus TaxID=60185 RepID=A0AAD5JPQ3_9FUNG|nr:hypothetical protein BDA99DRAFT_225954 [Phascolomyces articulosus]
MEDEEGQDLAEREIQRRMHLMTEASRVIDLTEISHVQRSFGDDDGDQDDNNDITDANDSGTIGLNSPSPQQLEDQIAASRSNSVAASILRIQQEEMLRTSSARQRQRNPILEIIMENGLIIRLKADSSEACDAWVQNLAYLTLYWRARKEAQRNINAKHDYTHMFDEDFRYAITHQEKGSDFNKPPVVDTRIWSICCFEQCRDIVKTGVMYFQPRSRGTFSQKIFVLTGNGWLIYYNIYDRAAVTCQPIQAAVHDRKDAVDITGCYIYSSPSPRRPARIFPDGIASADANDDSLFSLWKPQSRRVFSPKRQRIQVYKHHRTFFQEDGETWQFLAKNRHEKEEWVWAFNVIIERLLRGGVSQ